MSQVPDTVMARLADKSQPIALVGASDAPHKYGHIILVDLMSRGHAVLPVNPSAAVIEGQHVYPSLSDVDIPVGIINVVIPPHHALAMLEDPSPMPSDIIWFQPGSFNDAVVDAARERFETVVAGPCIMVMARQV